MSNKSLLSFIGLFFFNYHFAPTWLFLNNLYHANSFAKSEIVGQAYPILYDKTKALKAMDDRVIAIINNEVSFEVLGNDEGKSGKMGFGIITQPKMGKVKINENFSITYVPSHNVCEEMDAFTYYISNEEGFDTASVFIEILCEPLTVVTGFSPYTEVEHLKTPFTILGIENYPDSQLIIFDNWGKEVFQKKGYRNDWYGTVDEKLIIPGSYYYMLTDGLGNVHAGNINVELE